VTGFDEIKARFWDDGDYGVQAPLSREAVAEAEQALGVRLPASLLELLEVRNGGVVAEEFEAFPTNERTSWAEDHVPFEHLMGIGPPGAALTLLDSPYLVREWGLPSPLVLLSGDGHTWIALDYRECGPQGEPTVAWFDADHETDLLLAPDFRSFVEGLRLSPA
jgi:SMI1/KNR4 family protein SUKH-1